jgi:hypothetical protein
LEELVPNEGQTKVEVLTDSNTKSAGQVRLLRKVKPSQENCAQHYSANLTNSGAWPVSLLTNHGCFQPTLTPTTAKASTRTNYTQVQTPGHSCKHIFRDKKHAVLGKRNLQYDITALS